MSIYRRSSLNRSARTTWRRLARETQISLAFRETVLEKRPSGANEDDVEDLMNELYQKRAGRKDKDGVFMYAPPFKFRDAASELANVPKFESKGTWGKNSKPCSGSRARSTESKAGIGGASDSAHVQSEMVARTEHAYPEVDSVNGQGSLLEGLSAIRERPKGIRRLTEEQKVEAEVQRMELVIDKLSKRMDEGTSVLKRIQSHAERQSKAGNAFRLLQILLSDSDTYRRILEDLLKVQEDPDTGAGVEESSGKKSRAGEIVDLMERASEGEDAEPLRKRSRVEGLHEIDSSV